jgi:hypothetical protein
MAFPTVPTTASGDLLSSTTSPASTTHTFPSLSSLRGGAGPQAGDLLLAICVQYQGGTANAEFSSWGASFSEILDDALASGTGNGANGVAYKVATGSESGTFTVTSAHSFKSVQFLMRIPAEEWRGSGSPPEVLGSTRATGLAADPGSLNPSGWDAEDTLWIAIAGQTETSTTGSPPTLDSPPANFSGQLIVARVADAVGDITAGVAFRQQNAAAQDVGTWTGSNLNRGNGIATVIAVRPSPSTLFGVIAAPFTFGKAVAGIIEPQATSVAEISLESHGTPVAQTNHSIKVRARTTTGATGVLHVALYEGTTNRSGDLYTTALSNTLADYTLTIADVDAANITDYSNLSLRIWGEAPNGGSLVFEVADIYLELPESAGPTTYYGATSLVVTFGKSVAAITSKKTSVAEISLASHGTPTERTNHRIKIRARTTSGSTGVMRAALYEGSTNRSGDLSSDLLTNSLAEYTLVIPDASAENITDYSNLSIKLWGFDGSGNALTFEVAEVYLSLPEAGAATYYGAISLPVTFVEAVSATRQTFGVVAAPFTFVKSVLAQRTTFGQIAEAFTFTKAVSGKLGTFGQTATVLTFTKAVVASKTTWGQIAAPFTFAKDISGRKTTFGQIAAPFTFVKSVLAQRTTFGQISAPFIFTKVVSGIGIIINQISTSFAFNRNVTGLRTTFSQIAAPFTFTKIVSGTKQTFGQITAPFIFVKEVSGQLRAFGQIAAPFTFVKNVVANKTTFGQITALFTFVKDVLTSKTTFGQLTIPVTFVKNVDGKRTTFSSLLRPFVFSKDVSAHKTTFAQVDMPVVFLKEVSGVKETFAQIDFPITATFAVVAEVQGIRFGATSMSLVFVKETSGQRETFGQIASPYIFIPSTQGLRTTFGAFDRPFVFSKEIVGQRETFGQIVFPINATFVVVGESESGGAQYYGQLAMGLVFDEQITGYREAFGQIAAPYLFATTSAGTKTTFGQLESQIDFVIDAKTGRVEAFSQLAFEILLGLETMGFVRPPNVILNLAKAVYLGSTEVDAVYVDSQNVWSK